MTGSIQTKNGRKNYFAVLNFYDNSGKRKQKWIDTGIPIKGNNKRRATSKLNELITTYGESCIDFSKNILFIDYFKLWLDTAKINIAPTTYDTYEMIMNTHITPYFANKKLYIVDLAPTHIQQYVNEKLESLSPNTVRKHLANISKCLDSAVKQNIIAYNPVKRIEMPRKVKYTGAKHYNEKQIEQLLVCSKNDPLEIVIQLTLFYGLRRSEVLGLKWDAINFDDRTLAIRHTVIRTGKNVHKNDRTKNESSCSIFPMSERVAYELEKWRDRQLDLQSLQPNDYFDSDYVCTHEDGRLLSPDYVSHHFSLLLRKNKMPSIRFHDLRHSAASYLKSLGFDLKDIQTWLRHKDIQTTMNLYTHLDMSAKTNIANMLDAKLETFNNPNDNQNKSVRQSVRQA